MLSVQFLRVRDTYTTQINPRCFTYCVADEFHVFFSEKKILEHGN